MRLLLLLLVTLPAFAQQVTLGSQAPGKGQMETIGRLAKSCECIQAARFQTKLGQFHSPKGIGLVPPAK